MRHIFYSIVQKKKSHKAAQALLLSSALVGVDNSLTVSPFTLQCRLNLRD